MQLTYHSNTRSASRPCPPIRSGLQDRVEVTVMYSTYAYNKCWKWPPHVTEVTWSVSCMGLQYFQHSMLLAHVYRDLAFTL